LEIWPIVSCACPIARLGAGDHHVLEILLPQHGPLRSDRIRVIVLEIDLGFFFDRGKKT
jgi:hypothetical protein